MPLISAVGTDCLPCEVQGEAEETAYDVNVALERDSLLALCCEAEETYRNKIEANTSNGNTRYERSPCRSNRVTIAHRRQIVSGEI
jgi:hypothetical protein